MPKNFALIIDKSDAFIGLHKERLFQKWEVDSSNAKKVEKIADAGGMTLFGGPVVSILETDDTEKVKEIVKYLESKPELDSKIANGLILILKVARTSTKKLESLIEQLDGEVFISSASKNEKMSTSEKLVSELNLNTSSKNFLLSYIGDDYEAAIPLVRTLSKLSKEQQYKVSEEDIFLRMPQAPGSVPPWNLEKPIMNGNITETIDVFRRVSAHSHFLVVLAVLRNKFTAAYKISAILNENPRISDEQLAKATGTNPRSLWAVKKYHKEHGKEKLQKTLEIIAKTEANVKGGSGANPSILMEQMLVRITMVLKK